MDIMPLLLIEDDAKAAETVARGFKEEGFAVESRGTGSAGLASLRAGVDGCILDMLLPDLSGLEVLRRARGEGIATPILILSACDAVSDRVAGLDAGADDYLVKPFAFAELVARVRALLRRGAPTPTGPTRWGDLELDTAGRRALREGRPLELSSRQFALLEFLVRHAGQVVTRGMIMERVFGYSFDPGTNIVDVHIAHLRRKVEGAGERGLIETVRGVGYRVAARES